MNDREVGESIAEAFALAVAEDERIARHVKRAEALKVLQGIRSGTPDSELTPEQRQAWRDYESAGSDES